MFAQCLETIYGVQKDGYKKDNLSLTLAYFFIISNFFSSLSISSTFPISFTRFHSPVFILSHQVHQGKNWTFFQWGSNFSGGSYFDIFPENVKYRKLLCVELLFSCKLFKPTPYFDTFLEGVDRPVTTTAPGGRPSVNFYPEVHNALSNTRFIIVWLEWQWR